MTYFSSTGAVIPLSHQLVLDRCMDAQETKTYSDFGWRPEGCGRVALVLQGGGALGAYQAGVYQAMHEAGLQPDSVAGVSIGGVKSAIIPGNRPENRLERLREFWETVTAGRSWPWLPEGDDLRKMHNLWSSMMTMAFG